MNGLPERYSLTDLVVVGHQHYGLLIQTDAGERGFVDVLEIADRPVSVDQWPAVGARLPGVVLGHTTDGRIVACVAPGYVALVRSVDDPAGALAKWSRILRSDADDSDARRLFFRSKYAADLIRWALGRYPESNDYKKAGELLEMAPDDVREAVLKESP